MDSKSRRYYVVWKGHKPGIYTSWEECKEQIRGYPEARYKSFKDEQLARKAITEGWELYIGFDERKLAFDDEKRARFGEPIAESLSVDAACSGNPGILEYRGVFTGSGRELFHQGPFQQGTVNLGEFLALVHALAYLKKEGKTIPVYSDSITAIRWVQKKKGQHQTGSERQKQKAFCTG